MIKQLTLVGGLVVLLSGCAYNGQWRVTDKHFEPKRAVQEMIILPVEPFPPMLTGRTYIEPEIYKLKLERTTHVYTPRGSVPYTHTRQEVVSRDVYNSISVGSIYHQK